MFLCSLANVFFNKKRLVTGGIIRRRIINTNVSLCSIKYVTETKVAVVL